MGNTHARGSCSAQVVPPLPLALAPPGAPVLSTAPALIDFQPRARRDRDSASRLYLRPLAFGRAPLSLRSTISGISTGSGSSVL